MAKLIVTYWRDIPAMVSGGARRDKIKRELAPRFQEAIDRAAMRARKISADAYMADWRTESIDVAADANIEQLVHARVVELEAQFPQEYLEKVIRAHGKLEQNAGTTQTAGSPQTAGHPRTAEHTDTTDTPE